jgi:RNA polymerase sigma-32 factor
MSKTTIALEAAVAQVIENTPKDAPQSARQRAAVDRAFAQILKLIAPRIRHFVRQYGLIAHWDDAEQCCAIAVHRAIQAYDPEKAQFTTFVNWQIRGELQSLRFRLMTDQRPSAKKVEATTVSLSAIRADNEDDMSPELMIEDEDALDRTESDASGYLAEAATVALIDAYVAHLRKVAMEQLRRRPRPKRQDAELIRREGPRLRNATWGIDPAELERLEAKLQRDREIVERRLFETGTLDDVSLDTGVTKERVRQITKRAAKTMAEIVGSDPKFAVMAETRLRRAPKTRLLPDPEAAHNRMARVTIPAPEAEEAETTPTIAVELAASSETHAPTVRERAGATLH